MTQELGDMSPASCATFNAQQRTLANLGVIKAITTGQRVRALDLVLADPGVRSVYEVAMAAVDEARQPAVGSGNDGGAAPAKVVRLRRLRTVPPAPAGTGPDGGAA